MKHELKCWPEYYEQIVSGYKPWELRYNDRDYKCGDTLLLREYKLSEEEYTGREIELLIVYILEGPMFGLEDGYCIMSLQF